MIAFVGAGAGALPPLQTIKLQQKVRHCTGATATTIMQLVEKGVMSLEDKATKYVDPILMKMNGNGLTLIAGLPGRQQSLAMRRDVTWWALAFNNRRSSSKQKSL